MARLRQCHHDLAECSTRGRSIPFRQFVAAAWRARDSAISEASQPPCDAAQRNASDHHLRGMRRAPSPRTTRQRAGTDLDRVPQLRASAPGGARWSEHPDYSPCSPAFSDTVRVGRRGRLPQRGLTGVAPSGEPRHQPAVGVGGAMPARPWSRRRDLSYASRDGDNLRAHADEGSGPGEGTRSQRA
jgi:hypothetical protein